MLTRCPACETTFRVTPEQLKARAGRVRCGQCQHAFNALDTLIDESLSVVAPPPVVTAITVAAEPEPENAVVVIEAETLEEVDTASIAVSPAPTFDLPADDETIPDQTPVVAGPDPVSPSLEEPEPISETAGIVEAPEPLAENPFFEEPEETRLWPWITAAVLAMIVIALQATIAFRVELATLIPDAKPGLVGICELIGCEVGLPAKVELLSIESSDLHPDPEQAGKLGLAATLKNRAPFAQLYPHLELTLTDTADKAIVRKVLAPTDYLLPKTSLKKGMQANADLAVAISIDPGDLPASGYRLYLFYP